MLHDCVMAFVYSWDERAEPLYLLLKRNAELGGYWQPVTGFIETGDFSLTEAALREVEEETGLKDFQRVVVLKHAFTFEMNEKNCSVGVVLLETHSENSKVHLSFEHTQYRWECYPQARKLLYWENNKETLDRIHQLIRHPCNNLQY